MLKCFIRPGEIVQETRSSLTVCIVNYQGRDVLEASLAAVCTQRLPPFRMILVDNASTDGSVALVEARFPQVEILRMAENQGPAPAREAGFKAADTRYVCMIDNDVVPERDCMAALLAALSAQPEAALAMPRILHAHDPTLIQYDGARSHFLGVMAIDHGDTPFDAASTDIRAIGSIVGACFMVDRLRWGDHVLQSAGFFIYHEDHDLGLRARQLGLQILSVPQAVCLHGSGTPGLSLRATGSFTPRRVTCTIANRWRIILTRYQFRTILLMAPTFILFELLQLVGSLRKGWHAHWWAAVQAIWRDRHRIAIERRAWHRRRRLRDGEVLEGGAPPFHPKLLDGRLERLGYAVLEELGDANWRLARPFL
jgi:GT2 family glycosyltransferase